MSRFGRYRILMLMMFGWLGLAAQHYQIGDVYTFPDSSQGVVFHLSPDGLSGWVVALQDALGSYSWGNNSDVPGITNQTQTNGVLCDTMGYDHTQVLLNFQSTGNSYVSGAVDFANGWYLPTAMQLRILHGRWPLISNSLLNAGGSGADMSDNLYWSSSEYNNKQAYQVYFFGGNDMGSPSGYFTHVNKTTTGKVRAIRNFTFPVYHWSNDSLTSSITVNPTQTTTYQVSVSIAQGFDTTVAHTIVVPVHDTAHYHITACDYYVWYNDTITQSDVYVNVLSDAWGCDSVEVLHLVLNTTPQVAISADTVIIDEGDTATLHVSGGILYQWYPEIGMSDPNSDSPMVFPAQSTYYHVIGYGPTSEDTDSVDVGYSGVDQNVSLPGVGCPKEDSVLVLVRHHVDSAVCNNDLPMLWGGQELTEADTVEAVFTSTVTHLDSIVVLYLTVNNISADTIALSVLENDLPYVLNDSAYYVNGEYHQTLTNAQGCDSLLTVDLTVIYNVTTYLDTTICADMLPFDWDSNHHFESADSLRDTLQTTLGADSVIVRVLHVMPLPAPLHTPDTTKETCLPITLWASNADSFVWKDANGQQLSVNNTVTVNPDMMTCYYLTATNQYVVQNSSSISCRVIDTICVEVFPPDTTIVPVSACDFHIWYGDSLTVSGDYPHTLTDVYGCDSVVTLHLTILHSTEGDTSATACGQFDWYENTGITESGEYTHTFTNAAGCDSVVTLLLTVVNSMESDTTALSCGSFDWYEHTGITEEGEYTHTFVTEVGCDSVVTLHLSLIDTALQVVSLTEDFCMEMSAELSVITGLPQYVWNTGETTPQITVTLPGTYSVTASQGDCQNSGHIVVESCNPQILLPNSITPSRSDGLNDVLSIPEYQQAFINEFEIRLFNRWGEQVFFSTDKHFQWNGECKGKTTYNAVYVYVIRYTDAKGKPYVLRGSVTVL